MATEASKPLPVKDTSPLKDPPFLIVNGPVGVGKSTEVAFSFPRAYVVQTNDKVLRAYESFREEHPDRNLPKIDSRTIQKTKMDPTTGELVEVNVEAQVRALVLRWCKLTAEGKNPYEALVFDEWSTIAEWIYEQMPDERLPNGTLKYAGKNGKIDQFEIIREFKRMHAWLCQVSRATRKAVVLVTHSVEPKTQDDPAKPHYGRMMYPGGPKFPIGTLIRAVCAETDVVVQLVVEEGLSDESDRFWLTQPTEQWERKFRDFRIKAKEDAKTPGSLRELLVRAGFMV